MNISTKSWHYRLINRFGSRSAKKKFDYGCHTTCTYIRALVWSMAMALFFTAFFTVIASFLLTVLVSTLIFPFVSTMEAFAGLDIFNKESTYHFLAVFGIVGWGFVVATLIGIVFHLGGQWLNARQPSQYEKANLIKQAYADKVDGICTLVKLSD
jgi:hypothetical protein